jgi:hypothetical protein
LRRAIVKLHPQGERRYFLERGNPINLMPHMVALLTLTVQS